MILRLFLGGSSFPVVRFPCRTLSSIFLNLFVLFLFVIVLLSVCLFTASDCFFSYMHSFHLLLSQVQCCLLTIIIIIIIRVHLSKSWVPFSRFCLTFFYPLVILLATTFRFVGLLNIVTMGVPNEAVYSRK